jgi:uncharacterized protein (TIGR02246 family)
MRTLRTLLLALCLILSVHAAKTADAENDIRDLLADQVEAWNRGNLELFVKPYAEDCTFVGKQIVKGREAVLARYKKSYPTATAMGKLTFQNLEVREIGERTALVTGEWHLERPASAGGAVGGIFSLVMKDIDDEWRIVLDHTS